MASSEVCRQRLLAEDGDAALQAGSREWCVRIGGGRDDDGVTLREDRLDRLGTGADLRGHSRGHFLEQDRR